MSFDNHYYVYLLANWNNKVLYVGVTNDLERRIYEHKNKLVKGFTEKYNVNRLVYFEETGDVNAALAREKEIKKWRREKKNKLIATTNPQWTELNFRSTKARFLPLVEMTYIVALAALNRQPAHNLLATPPPCCYNPARC